MTGGGSEDSDLALGNSKLRRLGSLGLAGHESVRFSCCGCGTAVSGMSDGLGGVTGLGGRSVFAATPCRSGTGGVSGVRDRDDRAGELGGSVFTWVILSNFLASASCFFCLVLSANPPWSFG